MPALQADSVLDLVTTSLRELGRMKWSMIATSLQQYVAMPQLLKKEKVEIGSGYGIQWNVQKSLGGYAERTGLYATDNVNVADVMTTANAPWRHLKTKYAFDRREITMNSDPARIVDLAKIRRVTAMTDLAVLMETDFWNKPVDSTDTDKAFGVPYWIVQNATEGFNGGDPSGFTAGAGGLTAASVANWQNWSGQYTTVTDDDLITKMRKASTFTNFMPPVDVPQYGTNGSSQYGYYTNYSVLGTMEKLLTRQNDNLGNDLASKDGSTLFRQNPVKWVPFLEADTKNPVYGINWSVFKPVVLKGEYLREAPPQPAPSQHTVVQVFVDLTYNYACYDRRANFVLQTA